MIEATAHSAFVTYKDALENGWLRQGTWNSEEDGRRVACALGVIDPELDSPSLYAAIHGFSLAGIRFVMHGPKANWKRGKSGPCH